MRQAIEKYSSFLLKIASAGLGCLSRNNLTTPVSKVVLVPLLSLSLTVFFFNFVRYPEFHDRVIPQLNPCFAILSLVFRV